MVVAVMGGLLSGCAGLGGATPEEEAARSPVATEVASAAVYGDPASIEAFTDPEAQLQTPEDLAAYLLPGLSGPGVDCVTEGIEMSQILEVTADVGAEAAATLVVDCVEDESFGKIPAMYAVGFEEDGGESYQALEVCAMEELAPSTESVRESLLTAMYEKRLDLYGPPESRTVASDKLELLTTCLDERTREVGPALPEPTDREPVNAVPVPVTLIQAGACVGQLPTGSIERLLTVNCATPHRFEVVGASFAASSEARGFCRSAFESYTGSPLSSEFAVEILTPAPGALSAKVVCLAGRSDNGRLTGSVRG